MKVSEIVEKLERARDAYYNSSEPIMSDGEFDALEEKLKELDPNNDYFTSVGVESHGRDRKKIAHAVPMLSMGKAKTMEELRAWIGRLGVDSQEEFIMEPKIDGLSATCRYVDGKLQYVATRGDGKEGQDISHIAPYIDDIPTDLSGVQGTVEVRGELYLPKDSDFDIEGRPLRNVCVGLINRKDRLEDLRFVRFAVFQLLGDELPATEWDCLGLLKDLNFNVVEREPATSPEEIGNYFNRYIAELRASWLYETDGLIISLNRRELFPLMDSKWVVDHHHHYAIAFKPPAETKETILKQVIWQVSRQGNVIPVANFEPIVVGGATLERATLNNYENVVKLDIHIGDTLLVQRANDVIPFVLGKGNAGDSRSAVAESVIIDRCPSCSQELVHEGVHLKCTNRDCDERIIQGILFWVRKSLMENIAEATVRTLYEKGIVRKISDLYGVKESDLENLEGFAEKKIRNFMEEIAKSRTTTARTFIGKLGIPLVQKKILKKLGINTMDDFLNFADETFVVGRNIMDWKCDQYNMDLLNDLMSITEIEDEVPSESKGKVAMTGKGPGKRDELILKIESMGYEFSSSITADLSILLCSDPESGSSKIKKARERGIEIVSYDKFFNMEI